MNPWSASRESQLYSLLQHSIYHLLNESFCRFVMMDSASAQGAPVAVQLRAGTATLPNLSRTILKRPPFSFSLFLDQPCYKQVDHLPKARDSCYFRWLVTSQQIAFRHWRAQHRRLYPSSKHRRYELDLFGYRHYMLTKHFDLVQKFTSNHEDWVNFGQYIETATVSTIILVGAQDALVLPGIQQRMEQVYEWVSFPQSLTSRINHCGLGRRTLDKINKQIDYLQRSNPPDRMRVASEDLRFITDMKSQVDVALKSFSNGLRVSSIFYPSLSPFQFSTYSS